MPGVVPFAITSSEVLTTQLNGPRGLIYKDIYTFSKTAFTFAFRWLHDYYPGRTEKIAMWKEYSSTRTQNKEKRHTFNHDILSRVRFTQDGTSLLVYWSKDL